jgi:hypothetical protein
LLSDGIRQEMVTAGNISTFQIIFLFFARK